MTKERDSFVIAGAGLDYVHWSGAVLVGPGNTLWGVRISYEQDGHFLTGWEICDKASAGPSAADGSFAQMQADPLRIRWARPDDNTMVGEVSVARDNVTVIVEAYPALDFAMSGRQVQRDIPAYPVYQNPCRFFAQDDGVVTGISPRVRTFAGITKITGGNAIYEGRRQEIAPEQEGTDHFRLETDPPAVDIAPGDQTDSSNRPRTVRLRFQMDKKDRLTLKARVGISPVKPIRLKDDRQAVELVNDAAKRYEQERLWGTGLFGRSAEPAYNELLWMSTWHPFEKMVFLPPGRSWMVAGSFNLWGWDENFNAIMVDVVSPALAANNIRISRGCERMGTYAMWNHYLRTGDRSVLEDCYQAYRSIYPPADGSLVRGNSRGGNKNLSVGKGMDDTPMREHARDMGEMFSLDACCYKAWSLETLGYIAGALGLDDDSRQYARSREVLLANINLVFWNCDEGTYRNRYFTGQWAITESPTSFYPWLAGAPSPVQSQQLLNVLLDPRKFWGQYVIPTLARDDPEFGKEGFLKHGNKNFPPYCYWRGTIWAPPNYLTYEGLKRYELDDTAAEVAAKSAEMWWKNWSANGWTPENFNPMTGERSEVSTKHQSWSILLAMLGVKELIDVEWWAPAGTMRFGSMSDEPAELHNYRLYGHSFDIAIGDGRTELRRDGLKVFGARGGPCVIRDYIAGPSGCSFGIKSTAALCIELPQAGQPLLIDVPPGRHKVTTGKGPACIERY